MKYVAIVDDDFISNFRVDIKSNGQFSDMVLVVTDKAGSTRGIGLKPLPKGHGRLIDADALEQKMLEREKELGDDRSMWESSAVSVALDMFAPTIVEADKEQEYGNDD